MLNFIDVTDKITKLNYLVKRYHLYGRTWN